MLSFYCFLTGYPYRLVKEDTPKSQKKIGMLGTALLIPVIIWGICGFLLPYQVLNAALLPSLVSSAICLTLVCLLERTIVMAENSGWVYFFRLILALLISTIGAIVIDEIVFEEDIAHQLQKEK